MSFNQINMLQMLMVKRNQDNGKNNEAAANVEWCMEVEPFREFYRIVRGKRATDKTKDEDMLIMTSFQWLNLLSITVRHLQTSIM